MMHTLVMLAALSVGGWCGGGGAVAPAAYYQPQYQQQSFSGWHLHSDGWYYWWQQNEVMGAWHPKRNVWTRYDARSGWSKEGPPPWS